MSEPLGLVVAAAGVEAYSSCMRVRPREMTGVVAYTGMRVNCGMCLQQWANAPRCDMVAWVRRTSESVGTCLWTAMFSLDVWPRHALHLLLELLELLGIKGVIPANVD